MERHEVWMSLSGRYLTFMVVSFMYDGEHDEHCSSSNQYNGSEQNHEQHHPNKGLLEAHNKTPKEPEHGLVGEEVPNKGPVDEPEEARNKAPKEPEHGLAGEEVPNKGSHEEPEAPNKAPHEEPEAPNKGPNEPDHGLLGEEGLVHGPRAPPNHGPDEGPNCDQVEQQADDQELVGEQLHNIELDEGVVVEDLEKS